MEYRGKEKGKNRSARNKELASIKNLLQMGNIPTATSEIIKYVEKYPDDEFGLYQYGKILLRNNRIQEAKEIYQQTANLYGKNRQSALIALGEIATLERKFKLACKYGQEEIQNNIEKWLNHTSENGSGDDITFVAAGVLDDALLGEDFEFQQSNDESETNDSLSEDVYTVPVRMGDENFEITLPKPTEINQFENLNKTTIKDECTIISI